MLKIDRIEIIRFELPLTHSFTTAFGTIDKKSSVLVRLHSNGLVGYGEGSTLSAPIYVPEYDHETFEVLRRFIAPALVKKAFESSEDFLAAFAFVRGHNFARTAIECAFWDLWAQSQGGNLRELIGGTHLKVEVGESLGIKSSIDELLGEVALRLKEGYKRIKVKIKPGWDLEPVREIRRAFGNIPLMVDGNSGYTTAHLPVLKALDEFGLMMIEQPLAYDDIIDHAELQRQISTPVCLDESILSAEDARRALAIGACKIINIKPGRVGGVLESKKIHDLCVANGVPVWCGGMLESSIGRFFNLCVASLPGFTLPADMSPSRIFFKEDLVRRPLDVIAGLADVPSSMEEYSVDSEKIDYYARERCVL
ncbi:MAG: o-succinylbenzoate synthase [Oligoflexia bacterium]|nr:o-succinylbenzoate synthase [Oligoflexia bacterium]